MKCCRWNVTKWKAWLASEGRPAEGRMGGLGGLKQTAFNISTNNWAATRGGRTNQPGVEREINQKSLAGKNSVHLPTLTKSLRSSFHFCSSLIPDSVTFVYRLWESGREKKNTHTHMHAEHLWPRSPASLQRPPNPLTSPHRHFTSLSIAVVKAAESDCHWSSKVTPAPEHFGANKRLAGGGAWLKTGREAAWEDAENTWTRWWLACLNLFKEEEERVYTHVTSDHLLLALGCTRGHRVREKNASQHIMTDRK